MAGQYGVDIWIRARDAVKPGVAQAQSSMRSALAGIGRDLGSGALGRIDRNSFRSLTAGLTDAVNDGLEAAASALRDWKAGEEGAKAAGARIKEALLTGITDGLRAVPVAGAVGDIFARLAFDPLSGGTMAKLDRQDAAQSRSLKANEQYARAGAAGDALRAFIREQQLSNDEEAKWIKLQEEGARAVNEKYNALAAAAREAGDAPSDLNGQRNAELNAVNNAIWQRRQREEIAAEKELHAKWMEDAKRKEEKQRQEADRASQEQARKVKVAADAGEALDGFLRDNDQRSEAERKWQDLLARGIELANAKYKAMADAAGADQAELARITKARDLEVERITAVVEARRAAAAQEEAEERRKRLLGAEDRLAEAVTSPATLAMRFRAQADQRVQRQAPPAQSQLPIPVDPALLKGIDKQTRLLETLAEAMKALSLKMPELQTGGA